MRPPRELGRWTLTAALVAFALAGGFFGGWKFALASAKAPAPAPAPAAFPQRFGGFGRPVVSGQVVSVKNGVLLVHDAQTDSDVKVTLTPGGRVNQTSSVSIGQLKPSQTVVVQGEQQADGSVRASSISVSGR